MERRSLKKNQGFNGIRTRDLCDTGAMLYQLSYEATHWERGQFIEFISSCWSPDFFQASSFQLMLNLENLLWWSLFTFIYNCSTNMTNISCKVHILSFLSLALFLCLSWTTDSLERASFFPDGTYKQIW